MSGEIDSEYVAARRVLLDALEALESHRSSLILVGAQAVYIRTGESDLAVAPFTTDADISIDRDTLADEPRIGATLIGAGFSQGDQPGRWLGAGDVVVDLLVARAQTPRGRRGARIEPHEANVARAVEGLEGALVDKEVHRIGALETKDSRVFPISVAGPAALLIAKLIKISERADATRLQDKDALDVFRLLRTFSAADIATRLEQIHLDRRAETIATRSIALVSELFGSRGALGCEMLVRATEGLMDADETTASCVALSRDLQAELK
ncbi:MAG: hypothetical protein V3V67_15140 [Myxococcota bacterium]